jgi:hypothetical protein
MIAGHSSRASRRIAVLSATLAAATAVAVDWQEVAVDESSNRYFVDSDRVTRGDGVLRAYVRTEYATPRERQDIGKPVFAAVDRLAVRCADRSFALESRSYVTSDGAEVLAIASGREELVFRPVAQGSPSAAIVRRLCPAPSR